MTILHQDRLHAGISFDWGALPPHRTSLADVPRDATELRFRRERLSHQGIGRFRDLRRMWLYSVNQQFLDELAEITTVEMLFIEGLPATALTPLNRLQMLRRLI